jgi:selenocysteine-specific elongation factor
MSLPLTVGTAGHIDHGKTTLVRALTGTNTDRLIEEGRRGISIELGFAELDLGGRRLSLIDVPGHERFMRTMIAGASGIDLFLMTVAADDGVMPQTREHATVLRTLGVDLGAIALTRCDLVPEAPRLKVADQVRNLFPTAPLVEVSAPRGEGLDSLRDALSKLAGRADKRRGGDSPEEGPVVLHVDRVFTVPGHGTVVTGTLWSGTVRLGDQVELLPGSRSARVRGIQVHDRSRQSVGRRQRVALNLAGLKREQVRRGDVVVGAASSLRPTYRLDIMLETLAAQPWNHERVQVHHGTREAPARIVRIAEDKVQLRLEAQLIAAVGDRVVLRRISPPDTIGGGPVLDPHPPRRNGRGRAGTPAPTKPSSRRRGRDSSRSSGSGRDLAASRPFAERVLDVLRGDGAMPRGMHSLAEVLGADREEVATALKSLVVSGEAMQIKPDVFYPTSELNRLLAATLALARVRGSISLAELRDGLGISRKYSQALLEYLDNRRITIRRGDRHLLRPIRPTDGILRRL